MTATGCGIGSILMIQYAKLKTIQRISKLINVDNMLAPGKQDTLDAIYTSLVDIRGIEPHATGHSTTIFFLGPVSYTHILNPHFLYDTEESFY